VTDDCGNFAECTQTITVDDTTNPSIGCPTIAPVQCAGDVPAAYASLSAFLSAGGTASDNCDPSLAFSLTSDSGLVGSCPGTVTRVYRVTDDCGNYAECTQTITVDDTVNPVITCPTIPPVQCAGDVPAPYASLSAFLSAGGTASDNCDRDLAFLLTSDSGVVGSCPGTVTRVYRVTDDCGNIAECTQTITVDDTVNPLIACPTIAPVQCAGDVPAPYASLSAFLSAGGTASDNCDQDLAFSLTSDSGVVGSCPGTVTRVYRVTDDCGNYAECTQRITVQDTIPPTVTCPSDILDPPVPCEGDEPLLATTYAEFTAQGGTADDNCGVVPGSFLSSQDRVTAATYPSYPYPSLIPQPPVGCQVYLVRFYSVADECGNRGACTQVILIWDRIDPTVTVNELALASCYPSISQAEAAILAATTLSDNCTEPQAMTPGVSWTYTGTDCLYSFTVCATDECDNEGCYTGVVPLRIDDDGPTADQGQLDACYPTEAAAIAAALAALTNRRDACGGAVTVAGSGATFYASPCYYRIWVTLADVCGNQTPFEWFGIRIDNVGPVCQTSDITVTLGPGSTYTLTPADIIAIVGSSYDACGGPLRATVTPDTFDCDDVLAGRVQVTVVLTDDCSNSTTCYAWVTVLDFVTVSVGTGYTILYPDGGSGTPFELGGPGNWMTVPVSVCSCADLAQLVFRITYERSWSEVVDDCCPVWYGMGLTYMIGTEEWNPARVNADDPSPWVRVETGVADDGRGGTAGQLVVYIDSPTGDAAVRAGCGTVVWLMFRVPENLTGFTAFGLSAEVIYATGMNGLEVGRAAENGVIYADTCNFLLDRDMNGRVEPHTDGVILYRALKYGLLVDGWECPLVPILPPEYAAVAGEYLPCDYDIVDNTAWLLSMFDLNVDNASSPPGPPPDNGLGQPEVAASRDGVYIYRNLGSFPAFIYPPYAPPNPYSPFVNPSTPAHGPGITVPLTHTDNLPIEALIDDEIDLLKVMYCDWQNLPPPVALPYSPPVTIPAWWTIVSPPKTLPLP
jgi:hypothetical protein